MNVKTMSKKVFKPQASSFWTDVWDSYEENDSYTPEESKSINLMKLSGHRRAIANFVNILTNQNIPVEFKQSGGSYTDGKSVTISSDVKPEKFDIAVGLALHEASHIKLTDFQLFPNYYVPDELFKLGQSKGLDVNSNTGHRSTYQFKTIKDLTNWVEDRRIDTFIFKTCPGYRDYYRALYNEYFYADIVAKGLKSDEYTDETIDSYLFRIININNESTDLTKLKGLKSIYRILDLANIERLTSTTDSLKVAEAIFDVILTHIDNTDCGEGDNDEEIEDGDGEAGEGTDGESKEGDGTNESEGGAASNGGGESEESDKSPKGSSDKPLSDAAKKQLAKAIDKQKQFINGDVNKKGITKSQASTLNSLEQSGTEMVTVGGQVIDGLGRAMGQTQVMVSKRMTESLMKQQTFPFAYTNYKGELNDYCGTEVSKGIQLGTILGKRLAVRSEERETINTRQQSGKIDKRLIAGLGFGYEAVFSTRDISKFKKVALHISIDASGSMDGRRWDQTIVTTVAICKAASMISNLDVQVSIRGTWNDSGSKPYVVIAYDSKIDKFEKVKRLFPSLRASGTTPEGLCYEAIMNHFIESSRDTESYFVNICDGEPNWEGNGFYYTGQIALNHTKLMVNKIRSKGIKVLSYFVDGNSSGHSQDRFKVMYGDSSRFVDINNIVPITKTLNELFLTR